MRDITTGEEKLVMYNVNNVENSEDSRLKSLLRIEPDSAIKDTF
jgi:hypothetical protein